MTSEKDCLIQNKDNLNELKSPISLRHAILLPMAFLFYVADEIYTYIINEWLQYKMRLDKFPGTSKIIGNFSACAIMNHSDENYIKYKMIQQETANWILYYKYAYLIPSVFALMVFPSYMDMYGRKFLFVITTSTALLKSIIITLTIYTNQSPVYIVIAHFIYGITGCGSAHVSAIFCYVADITPKHRHRVMGIIVIEALFCATELCSSLLSGYLVETLNLGFSKTAFINISLILIAYIMTIFILPETLEDNKRVASKPILKTMKRTVEFYTSKAFKGRRLQYILLIVSYSVSEITSTNRSSLETLYFLGQPFCWGPQQISYFQFAQQLGRGVIGLASIKLLQCCVSNEAIAILSTISAGASFTLEAFAMNDLMIYMVPVIGVFAFLLVPMIRAIMSTMTPIDKQGSMFASMAIVQIISSLVGVLLGNEIYSATLYFMNGFVFIAMSLFCLIDFVLLVINLRLKPKEYSRISIVHVEAE